MAAGDFPQLSREVTVGRNSMFHNLSSQDREELGGIEYRSLKLLLKIILGKSKRGYLADENAYNPSVLLWPAFHRNDLPCWMDPVCPFKVY